MLEESAGGQSGTPEGIRYIIWGFYVDGESRRDRTMQFLSSLSASDFDADLTLCITGLLCILARNPS